MSPSKFASWFSEEPPDAAAARTWYTGKRRACILAGLAVSIILVWAVVNHTRPCRYGGWWASGYNEAAPPAWYAEDLGSTDPHWRARAARALCGIGRRRDVSDLLLPALDDPSPGVRYRAALGIMQIYERHGGSLKAPLPAIQKAFDRRLRLETDRRVLSILVASPDALFTTPHHKEKAEAAYHAAPDS